MRDASALFLAYVCTLHNTRPVKFRIHFVTVLFLFAVAAHAATPATNWPQFRGPGALGVADNSDLPDRWSTNENVAWKIEVPGRGWSSPIVWGDRVFLTAVTSEEEVEPPKKG